MIKKSKRKFVKKIFVWEIKKHQCETVYILKDMDWLFEGFVSVPTDEDEYDKEQIIYYVNINASMGLSKNLVEGTANSLSDGQKQVTNFIKEKCKEFVQFATL